MCDYSTRFLLHKYRDPVNKANNPSPTSFFFLSPGRHGCQKDYLGRKDFYDSVTQVNGCQTGISLESLDIEVKMSIHHQFGKFGDCSLNDWEAERGVILTGHFIVLRQTPMPKAAFMKEVEEVDFTIESNGEFGIIIILIISFTMGLLTDGDEEGDFYTRLRV